MGAGVAPEAVGSLAPCDLRVDGAPIQGENLLAMREPPTPQGEAQGMGRRIREGDAQRQQHRGLGDWFERTKVQALLSRRKSRTFRRCRRFQPAQSMDDFRSRVGALRPGSLPLSHGALAGLAIFVFAVALPLRRHVSTAPVPTVSVRMSNHRFIWGKHGRCLNTEKIDTA